MTDSNEKALSLKEAAALLGVSYATAYANRRALGFFKVGGVWRIWPEKLKEQTSGYNADRPARTEDEEQRPCQSESAAASTILTSERQVEKEYAALVGLPTGRKRRSITTS
ncbi:MAG: helix-turn-helix domain-containing protein [Burkholderia cenocepacia]